MYEKVPNNAPTIKRPNIKTSSVAKTKCEAGPANDIKAAPLLGFFKFKGLKGTGLPHPKPTNSKNKVPVGSKCALGFKVSLPIFFAVGSPSLLAANAWENS